MSATQQSSIYREAERLLAPFGLRPMAGADDDDDDAPRTVDELRSRLGAIQSRMQEIDSSAGVNALTEEERTEFEGLRDERGEIQRTIREVETRRSWLEEFSQDEDHHEPPAGSRGNGGGGAHFHTRRQDVARDAEIWDLTTVRSSVYDPTSAKAELLDRSLRAVEMAEYGHDAADKATVDAHIERLLRTGDDEVGTLSRHILVHGSPEYRRAYWKLATNRPGLSQSEQRAMALASASGGYAVPYTLDPTILPTSNLSVNGMRQVSRVERVPGDDWKGVSSAGATAAFGAEATESSDSSPVLAQPAVSTEKAQGVIPYSIELGMDWPGFEREMANLIQDAKDDLEAAKFTTGSGTNEPFGFLTGATTVVTTAGTTAFAIADLYSLETALGPRFRARAALMANRSIYNLVRAFDTSGGAGIWVTNLREGVFQNDGATSARLQADVLGYPSYENSAMSSSIGTSGNLVVAFGDFSRYYIIVDRVGLVIENIAHLFGAANRLPTGQRALYFYWRTGGKVLDANAFRVLKVR